MTDKQYEGSVELLETISQTLSRYITESNPYVLFNGLLDDLLNLTGSEYGFIGETFYSSEGLPYIQSYATTNIGWNKETLRLYEVTAEQGMVFAKLDSLYGAVLKTSRPVISNDPANDPRRGGLPKGHPPLNSFLGLPMCNGSQLQGVVGIANRNGGYDEALIDYLAPFISTCSNLIRAYRNNVRRRQVEDELASYKRRLASVMNKRQMTDDTVTTLSAGILVPGDGYRYCLENRTLLFQEQQVHLSRKEALLFHLLASQPGHVVPYPELEQQIWPTVIVDESSLRSLLRRVRQKVPGLNIKTIAGVGCLLLVE
ncbi:GAF domain-containing protein [Aliamphritea hakodatensis]|uniref:GAF domain-containing protein n=1 Tax=Aliamphritea hakodatensis TaxID=2895352 RepID=UPI0022FD535A|nr:GAF domain-containing protein [Aliamphritea hakodatensis]